MTTEPFAWWNSLRHGGMLIAPSRLPDHFEDQPLPLSAHLAQKLRRDFNRVESDGRGEAQFLTTVLEHVCGLESGRGAKWFRGSDVGNEWSRRALSGDAVRPRRLWTGLRGAVLPVFVDSEKRLGVGRGRRSVSRVIEWLRLTDQRLALITNLRQWRLVYAGLDHDAWAEWDADLWFEEGKPGPQVDALRALLSPKALTPPAEDEASPLLRAVLDSRKGEAELSSILGERVRQAVELLIQSHSGNLTEVEKSVPPAELYRAATRVVMRLVVLLFAEARDLLPRENPVYHGSYGLEALREELSRYQGAAVERLRNRHTAWPRILALFRLLHEGSPHEQLPVLRYGGGLFRPGDSDSDDAVLRGVSFFESVQGAPSNAAVQQILQLLCTTKTKVRQGAGATRIDAPVDFSDLSSEYIGILYEGLLDFELRRAQEDEPIVFLALGDEPALPLTRLEGMTDAALSNLVEKVKVKGQRTARGDEGDEEEGNDGDDEAGELEPEEEDEQTETSAVEDDTTVFTEGDEHLVIRQRATEWAKRAVVAGGLVAKPRSRNAEALRQYEEQVEQAAPSLIRQVVLPGEWYLVRWGGTRKGAGTFYTRPQLAVPTVQRTLLPLACDPPVGKDGSPDADAPIAEWIPKPPLDILKLKLCDPAMGSGSFLVAALRFLAELLYRSLVLHGWLVEERGRLKLGELPGATPSWLQECLRDLPLTHEDFESHVRARLKRVVVERCVYGVDLDPLAVELARLALWVETMDRNLPFEFLDHKLKCGNSLVGCWFDRFRDYPLLAWDREGGDKNHTRGVHYEKAEWTKAIKELRNGTVKAEMVRLLERAGGQMALPMEGEETPPESLHDRARKLYEKLQTTRVVDPDEREAIYRDSFERDEAIQRLREACDCWCALWFWPAEDLALAPTPRTFAALSEEARRVIQELQARHRFFHWELEFPDVFTKKGDGFHAMVGNPPWDIVKPNSKEFFSNVDPLYRTYGKQEAVRYQTQYFEGSRAVETEWLRYCAELRALSAFTKQAASPFGDGADGGSRFSLVRGNQGVVLHDRWKRRRADWSGYADPSHPFQHQGGGDVNTYKLFLEQAHALLRKDGQLGFLVPSGIYTDKGSTPLRTLFLDRCQWEWMFGFENRDGIFSIHRSFKFCPVILRKGGTTESVRAAFMHHDLDDWAEAERYAIPYRRAQVTRFSPKSRALLEIRTAQDLVVLEKIYGDSVLLGDDRPDGWGITYVREFDMTGDSKLFPPRPTWEAKGYQPNECGRWVGPDGDVALPLYQGVMVGQFDSNRAHWLSGTGLNARWDHLDWADKAAYGSQFLMSESVFGASEKAAKTLKVGFRDIARTTDQRTMICALIPSLPCGNKVPVLKPANPMMSLPLCGLLNSWVFDWQERVRQGATSINYFIIEETPLTHVSAAGWVGNLTAPLAMAMPIFAPEWLLLRATTPGVRLRPWRHLWAVTPHERLRLRCMLDAIVAELYGIEWDDLAWILRDCDHPSEKTGDSTFTRALDPKGFWRVDKQNDPELRHTVLCLVAFRDLKEAIASHGNEREAGIEAFCNQHEGDGWMLPEMVRVADYGLGHDDRAKKPQPVRQPMGERFLPWQLEQSAEESWAECERHARNILGEEGFKRLMAELKGERKPQSTDPEAGKTDLFGNPVATDLFGNPIEPGTRRKRKR